MSLRRRRSGRQDGAALIFALMVTVVLGTVATLMFERSRLLTSSTAAQHAHLRAFWAADGGLAHARHRLAHDAGHRGAELELGGCTVTTTVEHLGRGGEARWRVRARARSTLAGAPATCILEAELRPAPASRLPAVVSWSQR